MHALLDGRGLFLCYDQFTSSFCQVSPGNVQNGKALVYLLEGFAPTLVFERRGQQEEIPTELRADHWLNRLPDVKSLASDPIPAHWLGNACVVAMNLSSHASCGVKWEGNGIEASLFELVDRQIADDIVSLCQDRWIVMATQWMLDFRSASIVDGELECDGYSISIANSFPFINAKRHKDVAVDITIVRDGWKVDCLRRYRPVVVIVQFSDNPLSMRMIKVLTTSLIEIGEFDGDLLVIGDQDRSHLEAFVHPAFRGRVMTSHRTATGGLDFCMARWSMADIDALEGYQPILYIDTDVICDGAMGDMLIALACADRISAQIEYFNPAAEAESCGNFLFEQDPIPLDGLYGFCSGAVGLPNLYSLGAATRLISVAATAYVQQHGPQALLWNDQPVVNYVLRKLCIFEEGPVGRATTIPENADEIVLAERRGFVHFWRAGSSANRADQMERYLARLTEAKALGKLPDLAHVAK